MTTIATHPELNRIAIKQGIDAECLLWAVLRDAVANKGLSSKFTREEAYSLCLEVGLSWTRRHFNRILDQGNYLFWTIGTTKIYMRSFKKVYNRLADQSAAAIASSQWVMIKPQKSALLRRAEFYWSWFAVRGEQTIARDTLRDLFGLSHDQQRAYERELGKRLVVKSNYCHIDFDLYGNDIKNIPTYAFNFIQERFQDDKVETVNVLAYQLPNTYISSKSEHGESPRRFAPKRALSVCRLLYRRAMACGYNERLFYNFYDEWEQHMNGDAYIRTYYQGKKRIWRMGHFF